MRHSASALCFSICLCTRSGYVSTSSATVEVALNAPLIALAARACTLHNVWRVCAVYAAPMSYALDHAEQAYIICVCHTLVDFPHVQHVQPPP